jgi:hypothetical protein
MKNAAFGEGFLARACVILRLKAKGTKNQMKKLERFQNLETTHQKFKHFNCVLSESKLNLFVSESPPNWVTKN